MNDDLYRQHRETFLYVLLTVLVAAAFFLLLFAVCGGIFLQMLVVMAGVAVVGVCHYLFWGHNFSQDVAENRQADEAADERYREDDPYTGRY
jgi:fatty acid desaturase